MSLLTQQVTVSPGQYFTAIQNAVSGGGGGGGGANPAFSSITIQTGVMTTNSNQGFVFQNTTTPVIQDAYLQGQSNLPMAAGPGVANIFLLNSASGTANSLTLGAGNDNAGYIWSGSAGTQDGTKALYIQSAGVYMSSLNVSTVNGLAYPPSQSDVFSSIQVSSINGLQYPPSQSDNFSTLNCSTLLVGSGYIDAPAVNGSLRIQRYTSGSQGSQIEYLSSGINCAAVNFGISTLEAVQADFKVSSINNQQPVGTPAGQQMAGGLQAGYVNQLPYNSTVLFPYPYIDDKVSVMLTATDAGVGGGANPNISLSSAYGNNGVSSIGFAVDMRNNGLGFTGNFYWMAFPWTN